MDNRRKVCSVIILLAFLCALTAGCCEGIRERKLHGNGNEILGNGVPWISKDIDEFTAEQVWIHCRKELEETTESIEDFNLSLPDSTTTTTESGVLILRRRLIQIAIADLPPQVKQTLLVCLQTKRFASQSHPLFIKWQEFLSKWYSLPRRYLVRRKHQEPETRSRKLEGTPVPAKSPTNSAPADKASSPSGQVRASPPKQARSPPAPAPKPSRDKDLVRSPPAKKPSPNVRPPPPPQPKQPKPKAAKPQNDDENKNLIIGVIVGTAVTSLAIFALILVCCLRRGENRIGPKDGQRDDKPLLNISSDLSGSSQMSQSLGSSSNKDFMVSSITNMGHDTNNSSLAQSQPSEATLGSENAPLPLPPGRTAPPAPQPPPAPPKPPAPAPPPPPKIGGRGPPKPPIGSNLKKGSPNVPPPHMRGRSSSGDTNDETGDSDAPKTKLKPFFWDKVLANPDHSMVWHEIKAGSFQFNEEMMESLFGYAPNDKAKNENGKASSSFQSQPQLIQIIDPRKAQNLAILLKALNVTTEEVCDALKEGNELPTELIQTLLKMAPTTEEELKLRLYNGELSRLGPAERFLKVLVEIPHAFKRLEALLFKSSLQEEFSSVKESFSTLEVACTTLKNSRLFLKLLEAVLKTGNRMNDGTFRGGAMAFKLDTLLKLSDVKGTDGKTTLLHFVVQEIIRSEGVRAARSARANQSMSSENTEDLVEDSGKDSAEYLRNLGLQVVSGLSNELEDVRKAALIDGDSLTSTVSKLGQMLLKTKDFVEKEMKNMDEEESEFRESFVQFVQKAEEDILWMLEEEKRIMALVKSTGDYFHGHSGKDEGLRLFVIVRDFLIILDKVCNEVKKSGMTPPTTTTKKEETPTAEAPSQESPKQSLTEVQQRLFPAIRDRQMDYSSSDDESSSSESP